MMSTTKIKGDVVYRDSDHYALLNNLVAQSMKAVKDLAEIEKRADDELNLENRKHHVDKCIATKEAIAKYHKLPWYQKVFKTCPVSPWLYVHRSGMFHTLSYMKHQLDNLQSVLTLYEGMSGLFCWVDEHNLVDQMLHTVIKAKRLKQMSDDVATHIHAQQENNDEYNQLYPKFC